MFSKILATVFSLAMVFVIFVDSVQAILGRNEIDIKTYVILLGLMVANMWFHYIGK